jgi:hypothetical protein
LRAEYVSGQYGVILPANFLKEKDEMRLKVYNKDKYYTLHANGTSFTFTFDESIFL